MSALDDIVTERDRCLGIIDGKILDAEAYRIAGFDMTDNLKKLRRRHKEIEDKALDAYKSGYAKALTKQLGTTDPDDWPFVNGRFLKPDTILSVDVEPS